MHSKSLSSVAAAVSAVLLHVAFVTPAHAQVKAALTRDIDRPSAQPVTGYCISQTDPNLGPLRCTLYSVPAGKRLVVETVSYAGIFQSGDGPIEIVFGLNNPTVAGPLGFPASAVAPNAPIYSNTYSLVPTLVNESLGARYFALAQALRIYIDENQQLAASATDISDKGNGGQRFAFSGYLVDK